jgi:hypothetical protein
MKGLLALILVSMTAGCASFGRLPSNHRGDGSSLDATHSMPATPMAASSSQTHNIGPSLVLPATGGAPVMAIQLGGNIYQPVTGGPPVVGMRLTP